MPSAGLGRVRAGAARGRPESGRRGCDGTPGPASRRKTTARRADAGKAGQKATTVKDGKKAGAEKAGKKAGPGKAGEKAGAGKAGEKAA